MGVIEELWRSPSLLKMFVHSNSSIALPRRPKHTAEGTRAYTRIRRATHEYTQWHTIARARTDRYNYVGTARTTETPAPMTTRPLPYSNFRSLTLCANPEGL